jgi:hypothetical protein
VAGEEGEEGWRGVSVAWLLIFVLTMGVFLFLGGALLEHDDP